MSAEVEKLKQRLARAVEKVERLDLKADTARAKSESATVGGLAGYDPAVLSGISRKPNHKATRARFAAYDREAAATLALMDAEREVDALTKAVARAHRVYLVKFTAADLVAARFVRDRFGWHRVVRVSAKSVTVETGYSWTDRIVLDKILEFRA